MRSTVDVVGTGAVVEAKGPIVPKLLLTPEDAAKALSLCERKLSELTSTREIPSIKIGKSRRYSIEALRQWIADKVEEST